MTQRSIYQTDHPYHLTTVTSDRRPVFEDVRLTRQLSEIIQEACVMHGFDLIVHAILPDHIHMLVDQCGLLMPHRGLATAGRDPASIINICSGKNPRCGGGNNIINPQRVFSKARCTTESTYTVSNLMQSIKGTFSRYVHQGRLWQPRFNFRIVNTESRPHNTFWYIYRNYQKHGLSDQYGQAPFVFIAPKYAGVKNALR
jgi:REP element-mobilizing transposase RayT